MKIKLTLLALSACLLGGVAYAQLAQEHVKVTQLGAWRSVANEDYRAQLLTPNTQGDTIYLVESLTDSPRNFTTLIKGFKPSPQMKRLKIQAEIKSDKLEGWAGLWMRVDGEQTRSLQFDNMQNRPIKGTTDWKQYQVVLAVPQEANWVNLGFLMDGPGKTWVKNMRYSTVDESVKSTNLRDSQPTEPQNLEFN